MTDFKFEKKFRIGLTILILLVCFITGLGFGFYVKNNLGDGNLSFFVFMAFDIALIFLFSIVVDRFVFASKKRGVMEFNSNGIKIMDKEYNLNTIQGISMVDGSEVNFNGIMIRYWKKSILVHLDLNAGEKWEGRVSLKARKTRIDLATVLSHFSKENGIKMH